MNRIWSILVFVGCFGLLSAPARAETWRWFEVVQIRQIQCGQDEWQGEVVRYLHLAAILRDSDLAGDRVHHRILRWESRRGHALAEVDLCTDISRVFRDGKSLMVQVDRDGWIRSLQVISTQSGSSDPW